MTDPMDPNSARIDGLLRHGDSTLILAQRLLELCGHGPALEEDMAVSNVALDLLGQTRLWYGYACELEGRGRTEDDLAFLRDAPNWRNFLIVEIPNRDYAHTIMRQFLFDTWHFLLLERLSASDDPRVAEIAVKAHKEVTYHVRRSADMVVRLGDGTAESHQRMQVALLRLWPYANEMFASERGWEVIDQALLREHWLSHLTAVLSEATLTLPSESWTQTGRKTSQQTGYHTEHFGHILAEMQFLQRAHPGAQW